MAIDVNFYTFDKKPNSTKRPTEAAVTYKCNLIEPTSFTSPDIALTVEAKPTAYNYAYIPEFSRYYFITDWAYSAGLWRAGLSVDVMASYKNYIGEQKQYVLRSAARSDGNIADTMYPTKSSPTIISEAYTDEETGNNFTSKFSEGTYVVGIINSDSNAVGCVSYYVFNNSQFRAFCEALMGSSSWVYNGIEEIGEELTRALFNPFQYVASCIWLPIKHVGTSGRVDSIKYGWWTLNTPASRYSSGRIMPAYFDIPKHPQSARGAYLNGAPFSRYMLTWACFGQFPLDPDIMAISKRLIVECSIDGISGTGVMHIRTDEALIMTTQVQVGVPIQIAQMAVDYWGAATSAVSSIAKIATGHIGSGIAAIGDVASNAMPQLSTSGKNGGAEAFYWKPTLSATFYHVVDDDNEHLGRPLCQDVKPSSIPGYMLCADVELEIPCTHPELENIVSTMEAGFYYE